MSIFLNGRTLSCLVCRQSSASCSDQKHPLQCLMSYDELIAKYARKINRDQYDGIGIYTCPYCGLDRLTIDALYEHSRDVHLRLRARSSEQSLSEVHCPVCVCFRLETGTGFVEDTGGLVEHMLSRHCFPSTHQYDDEFKLRHDFCSDDEFELIRFLATILPPAVLTSAQAGGDWLNDTDLNQVQRRRSLECPICLEELGRDDRRDLPLCRHQFHGSCIDRWLLERNCCPICRCDCSGP